MIKTSSQKQISFLIQYYSLYPRSYSAIIRTIPFKASSKYCKYWIKIPFWIMNPFENCVHSVILENESSSSWIFEKKFFSNSSIFMNSKNLCHFELHSMMDSFSKRIFTPII